MSVTHNFSFSWNNGGTPIAGSVSLSSNGEISADFSLAGNTTNQQHHIAWVNAKLQSIFIKSDQTITLKTNSSGSPQDTLTITASDPFVWYTGSGITNPFAGDVTTIYATNGGSTAANVSIRVLNDQT